MVNRAEQQRLDRLNTWLCGMTDCWGAAVSEGAFPMGWWHVVQRGGPSAWLCSRACAVRWLAEQEQRKGGSHD